MRRDAQEELPLWPLSRWPSPGYLRAAFGVYFGASLFAGFLFFVAVIIVARPLWAAIFVAGAVAGVFGFRWCRIVLRRLSRIVGAFPHHA
jgi:Flp pilus assembly protein TadB